MAGYFIIVADYPFSIIAVALDEKNIAWCSIDQKILGKKSNTLFFIVLLLTLQKIEL